MSETNHQAMGSTTLITGGAGFIGCNLADALAGNGCHVTIFDNLSRRGSRHNLDWLRARHRTGFLNIINGDVRDFEAVRRAVRPARVIYHLAAQVAVTSSVTDPRSDFEINTLGSLNVLEAVRECPRPPTLIVTSTNKVYGAMPGIRAEEADTHYLCPELPLGVPESLSLDFHSPYGCSKGAMDSYVHDYSRVYGLPTVVFRMSCIYGPRQFGNEDQGWLAHFLIQAAAGRALTIYGDGKQVRDVLYIDDLVRALCLAAERIDQAAGEVFNIGGGPTNALAVWAEFGTLLEELSGFQPRVEFEPWRPGDQRWYVSDIGKAQRLLGWAPRIDKRVGIGKLWDWVSMNRSLIDFGSPSRRSPVVMLLDEEVAR